MAGYKVALLLLWSALIYSNQADPLHINEQNDEIPTQEDPVVQTSSGPVKGFTIKYLGAPVDIFLGIPFAKPPLDDLRFKKPVPIDAWNNTFDATKRPNSCQQERSEVFGTDFRGEQMWNSKTPVSEDCLYLNLWVPKGATSATTLIWIHGGGFTSGNSALEMYDGTILAATKKVIVASMNYRLGAFGFLYNGDVDAPGNVAFYDQALAIQWIKSNVESFGGDPSTVTLFGESAGASSINALLISPVTQHLTRRAILQSGSINTPWSMATMTPETAIKASQNIMKNVGCALNGMDCMRKVDAKILSQAQWVDPIVKGFPIGPTIDGVFFPTHPIEMLNEGKFLKAEILVGTNQDEGTFFAAYDFPNYISKDDTPSSLTREAFHNIIDTIFERQTILERAMIAYNYTKGAIDDASIKNLEVVSKILGDYMITCPVNYMVDKFSENGNSVYYYFFKERTDDRPWGSWMGAMHGEEIPYVFGAPLNPSRSFTKSEQDLSRRMIDYFVTFAETGKPDRLEGVLSWPKYSGTDPRYVILSANALGQGARLRHESCSFWNDFTKSMKQSKK